ncbi:cystathionine gamma-synthase [Oceanisphaera litoralis]|uniref:cystathionine gamma-synthase n=1 Tax=Oceanisphaera litoralis TaxID=225144 RepID=UPI00195D5532|nr:cystathionine gamma-synthase [Oceanisphaera litoralis]MBM7456754.1 cystathionine gamma-synthase [Oceanisphaera litoralis]
MPDYQTQTHAVRTGIDTDTQHGAVVPPVYLTSTYSFADFDQPRQFDYTRSGNPTRQTLIDALTRLEKGAGAAVTSTGMGAINLIITSQLQAGDVLLAPHDCYGGSHRLFNALAKKGNFKVEYVDQTDTAALTAALAQKPKILWIETPSNPLLRVVDIAALCAAARAVGALSVVDNTFLSPALQQPLTLGADLVVHSTTKYINGHSDVLGGAVVAAGAELAEELRWWANCLGLTGSPFDSYLTLRGLRTLGVRMRQHCENAEALITYLQGRPEVTAIYHPSLPGNPGHEVAARQQLGFGAMLSFELNVDETDMKAFLKQLKLFCLAESLGGVESLIAHPATMTHAAMTEEARLVAGISNQLLRVSVGIEDVRDLIDDFDNAFKVLGK